MKIDIPSLSAYILPLFLAGCVSLGGGDKEVDIDAMPTDTYENCGGAGNFLTSATGGSGGAVRLEMTECELINSIGDADEVTPQYAQNGERRIIMSYENPNGGSTVYLFVANSLKEINRVQ